MNTLSKIIILIYFKLLANKSSVFANNSAPFGDISKLTFVLVAELTLSTIKLN